jgi:hypothetical protein
MEGRAIEKNDPSRDWSVEIHEHGRSGTVIYRDPSGSISFYWEFGGGDTVAIITGGDEATWRDQYPWAVSRRAEILQRTAAEVIRQKAPGSRAEIDDQRGWINIRQSGSPSPAIGTPRLFARAAENKSRFMLIAAIGLIVAAAVVWGAKQVMSIRVPHGTPVGDSLRAGGEIATLIQTLERYVPSLHRNPDEDRYSLSLFLYPVNGSAPGRVIPLAKSRRAQEAIHAKLLGSDGRSVWIYSNGIGAVELATGKRIGPTELRAANPTLATSLEQARFSFAQRLRIESPDRRNVWEIDPQSLQAYPVREERTGTVFPLRPSIEQFLSSGVRPSPTEWLGLHSTREAERDFKPRSWLTRASRAADAKELRRFHRGQLGPELERGNREIIAMTPVPGDEYLNAAFVRSGPDADPLRLSEPDGFLMVFTSAPGLAGTLVVARVDRGGTIAWKVDTGIDRFKLAQILPDTHFIAFTGTRPPVPDRVSEPILVSVDTRSGRLAATTLWK